MPEARLLELYQIFPHRQTQLLQYQAGGMVAFVEADNKDKLLSFYENYGFKRFDTRQTVSCEAEPHELVQLLRLL